MSKSKNKKAIKIGKGISHEFNPIIHYSISKASIFKPYEWALHKIQE